MRTKLVRFATGSVMAAAVAATMCANTAAEGLVIDGEQFTVWQITDAKMKRMLAYRFSAPKPWRDSSQIYWDLANINMPQTMSITVENPTNAEAFFCYRSMPCFYYPPTARKYPEGTKSAEGVLMRPLQPVQALATFIQHTRGQCSDLKFIGSRDLPDLAKVLHLNLATTQHGIGEKVTYTLDGKPVEEEFYAVHYYQVVQGEALWGLGGIHSFRAPPGTLNKRRNVFAAMNKSIQMTRDYCQQANVVVRNLNAQYQARMKETYDGIAAAGQRSKQLTANSDAFLANVDRSLVASRPPSGASGEASGSGTTRTGNDGQDDYIRGVETMNDPLTGTSQHSFMEQYHWTDGYGNYRNSNDGTYNPNNNENGDWQLMTPAR